MEKISIGWANDAQSIVLCVYLQDGWSQEESFHILEQQRAMIESSAAPVVDVIVEGSRVSLLPAGASYRKGLAKFQELKHPRQGVTVFVGGRGILASMTRVVISLIDTGGREFFFVNTMEEALALLEQLQVSRQAEKVS